MYKTITYLLPIFCMGSAMLANGSAHTLKMEVDAFSVGVNYFF